VKPIRLNPVACSMLVAFAALYPALTHAQSYPAKTVRVVVPFSPGGAGGIIGMEMVARAPADGYTIMVMSGSFSASSATHKPAFDPINSIIGVAEFGITPFVLTVHPSLPPKTTAEFIALAKAKPGELTYASSGMGGLTHMATELLLGMTGTRMVHVPYKSTGAAMSDLLSGQAPIIVGSLLPVVPHIGTGKLRALGVTTAKRWYSLLNVPTVGETIPGYEVELWFGLINTLNKAVNDALQDADMKKNLNAQGLAATGGEPQHFQQRIRKDYDRWVKVVREAGIKVN
jgi:tripartite-type tricarboxylate transporter receptor subunit TctC